MKVLSTNPCHYSYNVTHSTHPKENIYILCRHIRQGIAPQVHDSGIQLRIDTLDA